MCESNQLTLHIPANNFSDSAILKARYLFFLNVAENFEIDGHTVEDFYDWAVEPLLPTLHKLALTEPATTQTL